MRIIAGEFRGKRLAAAPGMATRPTADRVREAVFSICAAKVDGAVVLDLFAGTGAFGIEALSRGAACSVFIDMSSVALGIIQKNIAGCGLENRTRLIKWNIIKNLNCIRSE
jgi:16S rRNA (guanine966-N2)-methyltransferase